MSLTASFFALTRTAGVGSIFPLGVSRPISFFNSPTEIFLPSLNAAILLAEILCLLDTEEIPDHYSKKKLFLFLFFILDVRVPARNRVEPLRCPRLGGNSPRIEKSQNEWEIRNFRDDQILPRISNFREI